MLSRLRIENYALIDGLDIEFPAGLSVITGQTGAGKSIILGAMGLLLGDRADTKVGADPDRKVLIEAEFSDCGERVAAMLEEMEFDVYDRLLIRREISPSGRSRSFVNDTPARLEQLRALGSSLLEIHTQHLTLRLLTPEAQLEILDAYVPDKEMPGRYEALFRRYAETHRRLAALKARHAEAMSNAAENAERLRELSALNPIPGEMAALEERLEILSRASEIKQALAEASDDMSEGESNALQLLQNCARTLADLPEGLDCAGLAERLQAAAIEVKDIARSLVELDAAVQDDPRRLAATEERIAALKEHARRYRLADTEELPAMLARLKSLSAGYGDLEEEIRLTERRHKEEGAELKRCAEQRTEQRTLAAAALSERVAGYARELGLPNVRFVIEVQPGRLNITGADRVSFLCAFNKNSRLTPVEQTASGGELSRLMLALRRVLASGTGLGTIIFDEIDSGVSGEIAGKMGEMMREMGRGIQVLAITHLPQVAAKGDSHFKVYKEDLEDRTVSSIKALSPTERVDELAHLLSGRSVNDAARANAETLLNDQ